MENVRNIILLILITTASFGQVIQERNASGADRRIILKNGFRLPQVCNVSGNPDLLNYSAFDSKGAMVFDTCANKIKRWSGSAWVAVADSGASGGGGIPIDSVAVVRRGGNLQHFVSTNSPSTGGTRAAVNSDISRDSANILIGHRAGANTTTATNNTVLGMGALVANTTGSQNVAIGNLALKTNGTGSQSVAVGYRALELYNGTLGFGNVAIGSSALRTSTAYPNVAIGVLAGEVTSTGIDNVFIGAAAGSTNTTGSDNVAIGRIGLGNGSGRVVIGKTVTGTIGNNSIIIATTAGFPASGSGTNNMCFGCQLNGGSRNVGVGIGSVYATNANNNTAIGEFAFGNSQSTASVHTGGFNVAIGSNAGDQGGTSLGLISGTNNILIGPFAYPPAPASSNQIVFQVAGTGVGSRGYNVLTRFTGGGWLFNQTTSAVTSATTSAALEVNGTTGAVLFPRLTTAQRDALTPTDGMVIYNTSTSKFQGRAGGAWVDLH